VHLLHGHITQSAESRLQFPVAFGLGADQGGFANGSISGLGIEVAQAADVG